MGRVKRSNALSWIFMRYVLVMLGSLVGLVIVAWLLLSLLISVGCIYPANYAEQKINEAYDTILRADKVTAEMIPALCDYVIFSENGEKIGGDLSEQYEQIAWNVAKYGNASGKYLYKVIVRENELVVLQYRLTPQYHSAFLREHFYRTTECDEYYVCDWSGSDYHHSVHTFWKKNQKADAACIRRNWTNKESKSGI